MGAGGLKIEPAAACSSELILHAAPVSSTASVRQPAEAARHTVAAALCQPPLASCTADKRCQVKSGYASPRLGTGRQRTPLLLEKGRDSMVVVLGSSVSSEENNSLQWQTKAWFIMPFWFLFVGLLLFLTTSQQHSPQWNAEINSL